MPTSKEYWLKRTKDIVAKSETNEDAVVKSLMNTLKNYHLKTMAVYYRLLMETTQQAH